MRSIAKKKYYKHPGICREIIFKPRALRFFKLRFLIDKNELKEQKYSC